MSMAGMSVNHERENSSDQSIKNNIIEDTT